MAKKFDMGEFAKVLGDVPDLGTGREQIEYIDLALLDSDERNFYQLTDVDKLAANIELFGLQQPIRIRVNPEAEGRFIIVSGHRRRAAIQMLVDAGSEAFRQVPCIRERGESSAALQELRLIYANSDTRTLTNAEISTQAQRVEMLLYQLQEEGYEFPGRMRDHVAQACKVSKSKLARLKVIREKLDAVWMKHWEEDKLAESTAYTLAQMPPAHQQAIHAGLKRKNTAVKWFYQSEAERIGKKLAAIDQLKCKNGKNSPCANADAKYRHAVYESCWNEGSCGKCCSKCASLGTCKDACPQLSAKIKKLRADAKAQRQQEKLAKEEKERPTIMAIQKYWNRFGEARNAADVSVKAFYKAAGMYYSHSDDEKMVKLECLEAPFTVNTNLPYGYSCTLGEAEKWVKIADLLGVSLDYLLCRTDDPKGMGGKAAPSGWITDGSTPAKPCDVVGKFDLGNGQYNKVLCRWTGFAFTFPSGASIHLPPVAWMRLPEEDT